MLAGPAGRAARERLVAELGVAELRKKTAGGGVGGGDGVVDLDHHQPVGQGIDNGIVHRHALVRRRLPLHPFGWHLSRPWLNTIACNKSPPNAEPNGAQIG